MRQMASKIVQTLMVLLALAVPVGVGSLIIWGLTGISGPGIGLFLRIAGGIVGWAVLFLLGWGLLKMIVPACRRLASIWRPEPPPEGD